jgi:hypothetical protein
MIVRAALRVALPTHTDIVPREASDSPRDQERASRIALIEAELPMKDVAAYELRSAFSDRAAKAPGARSHSP